MGSGDPRTRPWGRELARPFGKQSSLISQRQQVPSPAIPREPSGEHQETGPEMPTAAPPAMDPNWGQPLPREAPAQDVRLLAYSEGAKSRGEKKDMFKRDEANLRTRLR